MSPWQAIQYVGSGLSLVAFIVAAALFAYRGQLKQRVKIIQTAPEADRVKAIAAVAEFFQVDVSKLPEMEQARIVFEQIKLRSIALSL